MSIRRLLLVCCVVGGLSSYAQKPVEGTTYYLPRTQLTFQVLVEKTTYEPGQFAGYARRYLKKNDVSLEPAVAYRIVDLRMTPQAVPDTSKRYTLTVDKNHTISQVALSEDGVLMAINAEKSEPPVLTHFTPAKQPKALNPKDYMNEDILTATNTDKMARLTAQEIYDIRESRNQLSRGQAEFMPKDGEQLRIMMHNLQQQEQALVQTFEGLTVRDTSEVVINYDPMKAVEKEVLFRFSKHFGLVDKDDLSGSPYYIYIAYDQPAEEEPVMAEKKQKGDIGLNVNLPAKMTMRLMHGGQTVMEKETYAGQFGTTENLSGELFGKKQTSRIVLHPVTGGIQLIEEVQLTNK